MLSGSLVSCCHKKSVYHETQAVKCIVEKIIPSIIHPMSAGGPDNKPIPIPENEIPRVIFMANNPSPNISMAVPDNYTGVPPSEWLKVMSGMIIPVKSIAYATYSKEGDCVKDKETGQLGAIINIYSIQWDSNHDIQLVAGVTCGVFNGSGCTYKLKWSSGKWRIVGRDQYWLE